MFIGFFKNNKPSSFILLPLFALALWILGFFIEQGAAVKYSMPLYEIVIKPINQIHFVATLIAFLLIIAEAFLLNYTVNENEILTKPSFLPALFYIVFMSNDSTLLMLHPLLFANFFLLLALYKLIHSYRKESAFSNAFDAGIFLSIAILFYFPSIVFLPLLGVGFVLFRPFNWREWVISFIGILVPFVFVFTYYFWYDKIGDWWNIKIFFPDRPEQFKWTISKSYYFMLSVSLVILLFSFWKLFTDSLESSQKNRKGILLLLWFFAFALISVLIKPEVSIRSFSALAIPASVFTANYFLKIKKGWWAELLFLLILISIFFNHFSRFF